MKSPQSPAERQEALRRFAQLGSRQPVAKEKPKGITVEDVLEVFPGARAVREFGPGECPICNKKR